MKYRYIMIGMVTAWPVASQAQQPLAEYTVKLTPAQLDMIGEGLGFMPFNKAAPLINTLREQVMSQQQPKPEVPKVEAPKENEK